MRTTANTRQLGYGAVQAQYLDAGWTPLPLPSGQKMPPPKGYTGSDHDLPTARILKHWASAQADGNVALVMPPGVIGIDIDAYHGGRDTFRKLLKWYGSIPNAPFSTSRDDGSGIHFYRVPLGTKLVGKIDGGIEIIQYHHRFAVVYPSIHPEGRRRYRWHDTGGTIRIPAVDELPELPEAWLKGLAKRENTRRSVGTVYTGSIDEWMAALPEGKLHPTYVKSVDRAIKRLSYEGGRYDTMVSTMASLVNWGADGQPVEDEIVRFIEAYTNAVSGDRSDWAAESEAIRALEGAVHKFGVKA